MTIPPRRVTWLARVSEHLRRAAIAWLGTGSFSLTRALSPGEREMNRPSWEQTEGLYLGRWLTPSTLGVTQGATEPMSFGPKRAERQLGLINVFIETVSRFR
jgi:hypothetical protein